jgi:hypothetical protein
MRPFAGVLLSIWLALVFLCQSADSAPAPFERPAGRSKQLTRDSLIGDWTLVWSGQHYSMTLTVEGGYTCIAGGRVYAGTWGIDQVGRFALLETATPTCLDSWRHYAIRLNLETLAGRCEVGATGTEVRLLRSNVVAGR